MHCTTNNMDKGCDCWT